MNEEDFRSCLFNNLSNETLSEIVFGDIHFRAFNNWVYKNPSVLELGNTEEFDIRLIPPCLDNIPIQDIVKGGDEYANKLFYDSLGFSLNWSQRLLIREFIRVVKWVFEPPKIEDLV